jgi:hypothetical protein
MNGFTLLKRSCPVCNGARKDCRQSNTTNLIFCRDSNANPLDYIFRGFDAHGFGMWAQRTEAEAHSEEQRQEWQRQRELAHQQRLEVERQQRVQRLSESERDRECNLIFNQLSLNQRHREDLERRGLNDELIRVGGFKSVEQWQRLNIDVSHRLAGVSINGRSLITQAGYIWPIKNPTGQIVAWQLRLDEAHDRGRFRWPTSATKKRPNGSTAHLPNGELPIACHRPTTGQPLTDAIELCEGTGVKPFITTIRLNRITLGAAGGNFAVSPETFKSYLDELSTELRTKQLILNPDAGAVANPHVMPQYEATYNLVTSWGYELKFRWWGQATKRERDIDEIENPNTIATYLSWDELVEIAIAYGGKRTSDYTEHRHRTYASAEPDEAAYAAYQQWEDEQELLEEAIAESMLTHQVTELFKRVGNRLEKAFKGFGRKPQPKSPVQSPQVLHYPQEPLPKPQDFAGSEPPRIIFKSGTRLEVLALLKELGWSVVCDRSFMGTGKSHDAGSLYPDPDGTNKVWYFDLNHRNPSTAPVESLHDMPVRHNGMVPIRGRFTPKGKPHLRWASPDEIPVIPSLCHNAELFIKLKEKGYSVDTFKEIVTDDENKAQDRNPICQRCQFAGECHRETGEGDGYLYERRMAMERRRIRASLDSASAPDNYEYDEDLAFVEEASRVLRGTQTLSAYNDELASLWARVERYSPTVFRQFQPLRFALVDAINGCFDQHQGGINRGTDHETLLANLPLPQDFPNLADAIASVNSAMPTIKELVEEPDTVTGLGGKWRDIGQTARNLFKAQADRETRDNIDNVPPNILVDVLEVWAGFKPGALRVFGKKLHVTTRDTRHGDILGSMKFVDLLDATADKQVLAKIIGVDPNSIIEIQQDLPSLDNLTVVNVNMRGMGSRQISDSCKGRQKAILEWVMRTHDPQEIRVIANKLDEHLPLDGWWFNDNRSTNAYQDAGVIVAFNTPRTNLGVIQDEYRTLFSTLDGFNEYYQNLVKAEIIQLIGRPRVHLNPEKQFTIYLVGTDFDASFLSEFGVKVVNVEAFELCPEAGTQLEQTRFRILEAVRQLTNSGVAIASITQQAVAQISGVTQGRISQIASLLGGWKAFKKILAVLLGLYRGVNNLEELTDEEKWLAETYLPLVVNETYSEALSEMGITVKAYGVKSFLRILQFSPLPTQIKLLSRILSELTESVGMLLPLLGNSAGFG